jgi:hypothetical protein
MSQISYSANLAADDFPLLSKLQSRTVIVGKADQDYELEINSSQKLQKERRLPQAYYAHNVMPSGQGYQSIGYLGKIAKHPTAVDFRGIFVLRDPSENKSLFSPSGGKNYIWDRNFNTWKSINPLAAVETNLVTVAYLNGETYIYYEKIGCFKYNKATGLLENVVLVGLVANQINGICASQGFLLAWDDLNFIYRSQPASPLNFTPDSALGSGAGIPEDIRGKIVVVLPISNGYIVYTTANMVAAVFQTNIRYPFNYKEISGSAGIVSPDHVSWQDNLGDHYAWTIAGLQKVNKSNASPIFPEITDFLTAKIFENYNTVTNVFDVTNLLTQLNVQITVVGSRYIVISYGVSSTLFTHAIIFDLGFKRFGKVKIDHIDCFTYVVPNLSGDITWDMLGDLTWDDFGDTTWDELGSQLRTQETPKEIVGFLGVDGLVSIINFDLVQTNNTGVVIFGKYQYVRERLLTLDSVDIENVDVSNNFTLLHHVSFDGKTTLWKNALPVILSVDGMRRYNTVRPQNTGKNHTLIGIGTFNLTSMELKFHTDGRV